MTHETEPSDGQLLAEFAATDNQQAFATLVARHSAMVYGVCLRVLRDRYAAQDPTQAAFLALARKANAMQKVASVGAWLHVVAWRLAVKARHGEELRRRHEETAMREQGGEAAEAVASEAFRDALDAAMSQLSDRYREPLVLFYLEGRDLQETAQQLGVNPNTAGSRLARGREMLRRRLVRRGVTVGSVGVLCAMLSAEAGAAVLPATFISATVQAASLAAAGKLAAGVGTGVVSAQVASMTEGALKMMFVAKLKLVAAGVAACALTVGSVAVVAQQADAPKDATPAASAKPAASEGAKVEVPKVASNLWVKSLDVEAKSMTVAAKADDGTPKNEEQVFKWGDVVIVTTCVGQETKKASLADLKAGATVTVKYTGGEVNLAQEVTIQAPAQAPKAAGRWMTTGARVSFGGGTVGVEGQGVQVEVIKAPNE